MIVKCGVEKIIILKSLHAGNYCPLLHKSAQNHKFSKKNNHIPAWRDFKIKLSCFTQLQVNSKQVKFQISRNNFTIIKQSYRFDPKTTKCGQKKGTYLAYKVT